MLSFEGKSSCVRGALRKLGVDFWCESKRHVDMDDAADCDPEGIDLVLQLCTRMGMMMEDISPLALDASREGLQERVAEIAETIRFMAVLADAAGVLVARVIPVAAL